jgi:hypothetical protein
VRSGGIAGWEKMNVGGIAGWEKMNVGFCTAAEVAGTCFIQILFYLTAPQSLLNRRLGKPQS